MKNERKRNWMKYKRQTEKKYIPLSKKCLVKYFLEMHKNIMLFQIFSFFEKF